MKLALTAALLAAAFVLTGCDDPCKTGFALKGNLTQLETTVTGTIATPEAFDTTCQNFDGVDGPRLREGARFSAHVANDIFSWTETHCLASHTVRQCGWSGGTWRRYYCWNVRVCDEPDVTVHHRDGYEDALALTTNLDSAAQHLAGACAAHAKGDTVNALVALAETKGDLHGAVDNAETVLQKAGCYSRRGD